MFSYGRVASESVTPRPKGLSMRTKSTPPCTMLWAMSPPPSTISVSPPQSGQGSSRCFTTQTGATTDIPHCKWSPNILPLTDYVPSCRCRFQNILRLIDNQFHTVNGPKIYSQSLITSTTVKLPQKCMISHEDIFVVCKSLQNQWLYLYNFICIC